MLRNSLSFRGKNRGARPDMKQAESALVFGGIFDWYGTDCYLHINTDGRLIVDCRRAN